MTDEYFIPSAWEARFQAEHRRFHEELRRELNRGYILGWPPEPPTRVQRIRNGFGWRIQDARERVALRIAPWLVRE